MMDKWFFQLLIVIFAGVTIASLFPKPNWGLFLYGLGAMLLNIGVLMMMK